MSTEQSGWGVWLHAVTPVPELVRLAVAAEERGATALLLADEGIDRDLYVTLAAMAGATERLLLVPAITNPHSRHPVATAAALASLAELAPGRVVAGLGAGGSLVFGPMGLAPARPYTALLETVDVVDRLLAGEVVDHDGEFRARGVHLPWSPERLAIAIAGRGPRVERLAGERADWFLVSGKPVDHVADLLGRLRDQRPQLRVAWNPAAAWHPEHVSRVRGHFAYMTVDTPQAWRDELGVSDDLVARLRTVVAEQGTDAAAPLVPQAVLDRFSVTGTPDEVVERLAKAVAAARPDLLVFGVHDYTVAFLDEVADIAGRAGLVPTWQR